MNNNESFDNRREALIEMGFDKQKVEKLLIENQEKTLEQIIELMDSPE